MDEYPKYVWKCFFAVLLFAVNAFSQSNPFGPLDSAHGPSVSAGSQHSVLVEPAFDISSLPEGAFDTDVGSPAISQSTNQHGFVSRMVRRGLEDQKELYLAPFKPSNFKWDLIVLGGTAGFLIADRHIENALPSSHYQLYGNMSNIAIGSLGATLGSIWIYGIKTDNDHAKELGELELETLTNTFLIYVPMQFIAGRQRPGEGNGHGDFLKHHAMNTSFPGGHAMFAWAMATVAADEAPRTWEKALAYSAAFAVTTGRFLAKDHWSSDMFVGTALGIGIGAHIFHSRCDPDLSEACRHHHNKVEYRADQK